jgi:hypothetical protein
MARLLGVLLLLLAIAGGALFYISSREAAPQVTIDQPDRMVGQAGTLTVTAQTPAAKFKDLTITLEQDGQTTPLYARPGRHAHDWPQHRPRHATVRQTSVPQLRPAA